jgi:hypothetical protein
MNNKEINKRLLKIWKTRFIGQVRAPGFLPRFKKNVDTLFVGSNPSFSLEGFPKFLKGEYEAVGKDPEKFFGWRIDNSTKISFCRNIGRLHISTLGQYVNHCVKIEEIARQVNGYQTYFRPFHKIAHEYKKKTRIDLQWDYIDLFHYRVTEQSSKTEECLKDHICEKDDVLNEFGNEQVSLSMEVVNAIRPRVIWVTNAFASKRIFDRTRPSLNEELGTYTITIEGRRTPIFFSAMLTGGHMDTYSLERTEWHMRRVLSLEPSRG